MKKVSNKHCRSWWDGSLLLARLNKVPRELLYYPRRQRWRPQMLKFSLKFLKTSLFPNLITDLIPLWYDYTYWFKILRRIFMLKFYIKVFRTSLFFYLIDKREFRWATMFGDRSCLIFIYNICKSSCWKGVRWRSRTRKSVTSWTWQRCWLGRKTQNQVSIVIVMYQN